MNKLFLKLVLLMFFCYVGNTAAQVRVGHAKRLNDDNRRIKKAHNPKPKKKTTHAPVAVVVKPTMPSETKVELDGHFYVTWGNKRKLKYSDFLCNKNLYNKFLPASDTDLASVIYPDYRAFYKKLNERLMYEGSVDDFWQERVERMLKERSDSMDGGIMSLPWIDTGFAFAISIDSPAASAISISPMIYPVNETTYYYNITALFSKLDSWMIVKSGDILEHEQIHFDIFELYARKMRKQLMDILKKNYEEGTMGEIAKDITPMYEQLYQQINEAQLEFDRQTAEITAANGPLQKTNTLWTKHLHELLDALKDYEVPEGTIMLK